jgi:hypothetical protein
MKRKFLMFFAAVALTTILSVLDSWIIQQQLHGGINLPRAMFQVGLGALVLYLLWGRSIPGYVLASGYVVANALLYGYELTQYYLLQNVSAALPIGATVVSTGIILSTLVALVLLGLDYLDYRTRRIQTGR